MSEQKHDFKHSLTMALGVALVLILVILTVWGISLALPVFKVVFMAVLISAGATLTIGIPVFAGGVAFQHWNTGRQGWKFLRPSKNGNYPKPFHLPTRQVTEVSPGNYPQLPETFNYHNSPHITGIKEEMGELPQIAESLHEQPTLETVIEELRPNALEFVFGMDPLTGQLIKTTLPKAVHIQLVGASGQGKSRQAMSILTQLCATNDPQHLQLALVDHEGETSRPFWDLPHVQYLAEEPREAAKTFRRLVKELDRRDVAHLAFPVILAFCEEFLNLRRTMPQEYRAQALEDYTSLALRGRKRGIFVFSIGQTAYTEKTIRDAQAQFLSSMAFAVKPTAARSVGFTNTPLLNQLYSEKKPGQFLLERPSGDALLLAPYVDTGIVPSLLPTFSPLSGHGTEEGSNVVESGPQGTRNQVRNQEDRALEAKLEQVRSCLAQGIVNKAEIIQIVWGAKPGSSEKYRSAEQEYKPIMQEIARKGTPS